jgi:hypothetical protein
MQHCSKLHASDFTGETYESARIRAQKMNSLCILRLLTVFIKQPFNRVKRLNLFWTPVLFNVRVHISQIKYYNLYDWYNFCCEWKNIDFVSHQVRNCSAEWQLSRYWSRNWTTISLIWSPQWSSLHGTATHKTANLPTHRFESLKSNW